MALKGNTSEEKIWNFLISKIGNAYGVAGLMGNLSAESGLNPKNLENLCERKLKDAKKPYCTDETYTAAVDSGQIGRAEFLNPLPGKQYGYGLAQWTSVGRKAGLYDLVKSKGVSIGDLETQLEYLDKELRGAYNSVLKVLKTATSVRIASDVVLKKFESPADQSDAVQRKRAGYGQTYYNKFATGQAADQITEKESGNSTGSGVKQYSLSKDGGEKNISKNFKLKEFRCKDGTDTVLVDEKFVKERLQPIRDHFGVPVNINSAYRTPAYNAKVGGSKTSYHMKGQAFDIVVKGKTPLEVAQYARSLGINGIIQYNTFVHVDSRPAKYWARNDNGKVTIRNGF